MNNESTNKLDFINKQEMLPLVDAEIEVVSGGMSLFSGMKPIPIPLPPPLPCPPPPAPPVNKTPYTFRGLRIPELP